MFIPKEVIIFILGYCFCPITAYVYVKIKEYIEKRKLNKHVVKSSINVEGKPKAKVTVEDEHSK